jgi:hypothetical protein
MYVRGRVGMTVMVSMMSGPPDGATLHGRIAKYCKNKLHGPRRPKRTVG